MQETAGCKSMQVSKPSAAKYNKFKNRMDFAICFNGKQKNCSDFSVVVGDQRIKQRNIPKHYVSEKLFAVEARSKLNIIRIYLKEKYLPTYYKFDIRIYFFALIKRL